MDWFLPILAATFRLTTPIAFAALGAVVMERSGINALPMEGIMLTGAFGAVIGSWLTSNAWVGVLFAMVFAVAIALIRSYLCITHQANQTVSGVGVNILAGGFTAMMLKIIWNMDGKSEIVTSLEDWTIPGLSQIPEVGELLGHQNPLVILMLPTVILIWYVMEKTPFGLRVTTAGEHPEVLSSLGLSVSRYRYLATVLSAALAGLGGAYLSIGQLSFFSQDMTSGRGFMALAACVFGCWSPIGAFVGALLFGFADALQMRLQTSVQYTQFIQMIPYIMTLLVLGGLVKKTSAPPAASGVPYQEQQ